MDATRTDKLIAASIQWAEKIMERIDAVFGKWIMDRAEYEASVCQRLGDEQLFFSMKKLDTFIVCPQTSKTGRHIWASKRPP
jgi:hypothetical protein